MKLLYDLQLSVVDDYRDGRFLFSTDSNVDVASLVFAELARQRPTWDVVVPVPLAGRVVGGRHVFHRSLPATVRLVERDEYGDPFVGRMAFDARSLLRGLDAAGAGDVDFVYTNDPCRVLAYKTLLYRLAGRFVPVAARWHWVTGRADRKVPEPLDFVVRQAEGALAADACYFDGAFARGQFLDNLREHFTGAFVEAVAAKCRETVAVDVGKLDAARPRGWTVDGVRGAPLLVAWCHRLSYYTGWEAVFDAFLTLWDRRPRSFTVVVTDPGGKASQGELAERWPFISPIDRRLWTLDDYLRLCWRADVAVGNHTVPAIWGGLALTEPMAAYTAPLMPNRWAYREMCEPDVREHVLFDDLSGMLALFERLDGDRALLRRMKVAARAFCEARLSPSAYVADIVSVAERLVGAGAAPCT